jgi:hypothetical protein
MLIGKEGMRRLVRIKKRLEENRKPREERWREAARFINPNLADWDDGPAAPSRIDDFKNIYDNTVQKASNTLADGIQGYSFARNQEWFKLGLEVRGESGWARMNGEDIGDAEAAWMSRAERHLYTQLQKSTFYDEGRNFVKCCADFGTAVMLRVDDLHRDMPVYKTLHLKWCCIDENEFGEVDTLFRDFWIDSYEAAERFGGENLPDEMRDAARNGNLDLFKFTQAILPPDRYGLKIPRKGERYYSVFWADRDREKALAEGWYALKPFFVWRWSRNLSGDVWGVDSPGMQELPNIKSVNSMRKDRLMTSQLQALPPIRATEGLEGRINLRPRGMNYLRAGEDFEPALVTGGTQSFDQDIGLIQKEINESYYTDFFLILSQNMEKQKTATEVAGIQGEKAALMSSFYGRLTSEFLEPALEDLFETELRAGRVPPPPDGLAGQELRLDMISPLAQMQRRYLMLGAAQQAMAEIAGLAQLTPQVLDNLDLDQQARNIAEAYGIDQRVILDLAEVERIREARAQREAALQQFALQQEAAKTAAEVAGKVPPEMLGQAGAVP